MAVDQVTMLPETSDDKGGGFLWWGAHNGWMFSNVTSLKLIANAYGPGMHQVIGLPRWAESDRYELIANMRADTFEAFEKLTMDEQLQQQRLMTQSVLAERYQLKAHRDTRAMPVYELVVANQGLKIAERAHLDSLHNGSSFFTTWDWHSYGTMEDLACQLAGPSGGIVIDKTGLGPRHSIRSLSGLRTARAAQQATVLRFSPPSRGNLA
jgi:uncharacterized protein (TIGR03435 family)